MDVVSLSSVDQATVTWFELTPVAPTISGTPGALTDVASKVAVTEVFELTVTAQDPVPEQAPDQPAKFEPEAAEAVSVIEVPDDMLD